MVALGVALSACTREPEGRFAREEEPEAPAPGTETPLKFGPTIAKAAEPGETAVLLLEISSAADRRLDAVVGVHRPNPNEIAIEIWTFDQANKDDVLARVGEPEPLLRMGATGPSTAALQPARLRMASAGTKLHRLLGAPGETPTAALDSLAAAAKVVRDPAAAPSARVLALAKVFAGLDEGMIFERDAVGLAIDRLAADAWRVGSAVAVSDRRASVIASGGDKLELLRKGEGWVIATAG